MWLVHTLLTSSKLSKSGTGTQRVFLINPVCLLVNLVAIFCCLGHVNLFLRLDDWLLLMYLLSLRGLTGGVGIGSEYHSVGDGNHSTAPERRKRCTVRRQHQRGQCFRSGAYSRPSDSEMITATSPFSELAGPSTVTRSRWVSSVKRILDEN